MEPPKKLTFEELMRKKEEREKLMREKEEAMRKAKSEKELEKSIQREDAMESLKQSEQERKKEDAQIRGAYLLGSFTTVVATKEIKFDSTENLTTSWIKTDEGWTSSNPIQTAAYQIRATSSFLPTEIYTKLDLLYGFRRTNSTDFDTATNILAVFFKHYYLQSATMSKTLMNALKFSVDKLLSHQVLDSCCSHLGKILIEIWRLLDNFKKEKTVNAAIQAKRETKHMDLIVGWRKSLVNFEKTFKTYAKKSLDSSEKSPVMCLPYEVLHTYIFNCLDSYSLVQCSGVCQLWNNLANKDELYEKFLLRDFNSIPSKDEMILYKDVYIHLSMKKRSSVASTGLYLCVICNSFYWGAQNTIKTCMESSLSWKHHQMKYRITSQNVIDVLVGWNPNWERK